ncbi:hypothetical protein TorRG33x02_318800 [Trema orientale]|uniref:PB1-like domain-containing protein n=1 Tax=Trema orientale TaxID=63057 RepID=A0A2P5BJP4_TREOI|nr:hypothetical protein TorRG33x02_318800 [Trema orientale]
MKIYRGGELKEINGEMGYYGGLSLELSDCNPSTITIMTFVDIQNVIGFEEGCEFWCLVPSGKGLTDRMKLENNDDVRKMISLLPNNGDSRVLDILFLYIGPNDGEGTSDAIVEEDTVKENEVDNEDGNASDDNECSSIFYAEFAEIEYVDLSDDENWLAEEEMELQAEIQDDEGKATGKMAQNGDEDNELVEVIEELELDKDQKIIVKKLARLDRKKVHTKLPKAPVFNKETDMGLYRRASKN